MMPSFRVTTLAVLLALAPAVPAVAASSACLPPGVPDDVLRWTTEKAQTVALKTESGVQRAGLLEQNRAEDGRAVVLVWVRGEIVYLDTAPDSASTPGWVDTGLLSPNGETLLDTPGTSCKWRMLGGVDA